MWYLQTLGTLRLLNSAEHKISEKELVLLAYLALEGSTEREQLNGLFFPDGDKANLRGILLRFRRLGLVPNDKDQHVAKLAEGFESDVLELREALETRDSTRVSQLYRNERDGFLQGIKLESPKLMAWIESQREDLSQKVLGVKLGLLEEALEHRNEPTTKELIKQIAGMVETGTRLNPYGTWLLQEARDTKTSLLSKLAYPYLQGDLKDGYLEGYLGRRPERRELIYRLNNPQNRLLGVVGPGGYGKSALVQRSLAEFVLRREPGRFERILVVDLESYDPSALELLPMDILNALPQPLRSRYRTPLSQQTSPQQKFLFLTQVVLTELTVLVVLEGLERYQDNQGKVTNPVLRELLLVWLAGGHSNALLYTSRQLLAYPGLKAEPLWLTRGIDREGFLQLMTRLEIPQYLPRDDSGKLLEEIALWCDYAPFVAQNLAFRLSQLREARFMGMENLKTLTNAILTDPASEGLRQLSNPEQTLLGVVALAGATIDEATLIGVIKQLEPNLNASESLNRMLESRILEQTIAGLSLHQTYRENLTNRLGPKRSKAIHIALADYFEAYIAENPKMIEYGDLVPHIQAFINRVAAEQYAMAAKIYLRMAFQLQHLGYGGLLIELGRRVEGKIEDYLLHARWLNMMGLNWRYLGNSAHSVGFFEQAIALIEPHRDLPILPSAGSLTGHEYQLAFGCNLGLTFMDLGKPESALPYFQRGYEFYKAADSFDPGEIAEMLALMGLAYLQMKQLDKAEATFLEGIANFDQMDRTQLGRGRGDGGTRELEFQSNSWLGLAQVYLEQDRYLESQEASKKSLAIATAIHSKSDQIEAHTKLGHVASKQDQLEEARKHWELALELCLEVGDKRNQQRLLDLLQ